MQLHVFTNMSISNQYIDTYYPEYMASNESIMYYISDFIESFITNLPGTIISNIPYLPVAIIGHLMLTYSTAQWITNMLNRAALRITAQDIKTQLLPEITQILASQTYTDEKERAAIERVTGMRAFIAEVEEYAATDPVKNCTYVIMRRMDYMDSTLWKSKAVLTLFNTETSAQRTNALMPLIKAFAEFVTRQAQEQGKEVKRMPTINDIMPYAEQLKDQAAL